MLRQKFIFLGFLVGGGRDNLIHDNLFINGTNNIYIDGRGLGICGPQNNATLMTSMLHTNQNNTTTFW